VKAALILVTALLAVPATAVAAPAELSGPTPFPTGCGVTGSPTSNSTAEPHIAVDPRDARNVVAVWQQDRFNADGGALSNVLAVSHDGGARFHRVLVPGLSRCTGGPDERTSDPWLSWGPDGALYLASLTFSEMPQNQAVAGPTTLVVQRSDDAGEHWGAPVAVQPQDGTYNDREAITADPGRPGHAYYVFVKRYGAEGESGIEQLATTTDGGRTWSSPRPIYTPPPGMLTDPTLMEVLPDGSLLNLLIVANLSPFLPSSAPRESWQIVAQRSTDQGASWGAATTVATIYPSAPFDPESGKVVRAYPVISTAVARDGTAYVAWNEIPAMGGSSVLLARSRDGGRAWSAPQLVRHSSGQAFLPTLAAAGDGTLGITYDDTRNAVPGHELTTDVWFATSQDQGTTWAETHLAGPFDATTAPESDSSGVQGLFVGDYQGLAPLARGFGAVFAQARPQSTHGPSDLFFAAAGTGEAATAPVPAPAPAATAPSGTPAGARPRLRVTIRPRRVRAGRRTTFVLTVRSGGRPVAGARLLFIGRHLRTSRRGTARVRLAIHRRGLRPVVARKRGARTAVAHVRVLG
jgi:hypothetical protein